MKNIKKCFLLILAVSLITVFTNVKAYSGVVDSNDDIQMPSKLVNGQGVITLSRNFHDYAMSYQLVEIDNNTYKQIVKLKEELLVAQYYNIWEADQSDLNYDTYESAYKYYQEKYGTTVDDYTSKHIDEVLSQIIGLWPNYTGNWTTAEGKNINVDLSTISGTHDYVIWTKVVTDSSTIYDADAYELVGTKVVDEEPSDDNNNPSDGENNPTDDDNNPSEDENNPTDNDNNPSDNDNNPADGNDNPSDNDDGIAGDDKTDEDDDTTGDSKEDDDEDNTVKGNNTQKGDQTVTTQTKLPDAGILANIALFIGMALAVVGAIVSYRKMKNV